MTEEKSFEEKKTEKTSRHSLTDGSTGVYVCVCLCVPAAVLCE